MRYKIANKMHKETIKNRLEALHQRILAAKQACNREDEIALVAVSKTHSPEIIAEAYAAGQRDFGENYLQEFLQKMPEIPAVIPAEAEAPADLIKDDICWHYIGRIQSNKTKLIAEHFDWVQTVTSPKAARRLNDQRPPERGPLNICVQVNISDEETKGGCRPQDTGSLCDEIAQMESLRLRGLMTIGRRTNDLDLLRREYAQMHKLFTDIGANMPTGWDTLSMGMSADLEIAIEQGSQMLRIGSVIFGERSPNETAPDRDDRDDKDDKDDKDMTPDIE